MLDQENNFYLTHLNVLITCLLDGGLILYGEVTCQSLLGVTGLKITKGNLNNLRPTEDMSCRA